MAAGLFGQFDPVTERRFILTERQARLPFVRVYAVLSIAVMLIYALVNPLYFGRDDELRFSLLLVPTILCLGGYLAATWWSRYPATPLVDFVCLQAFALLMTADNIVLMGDLANMGLHNHASVAINRLIVTAFAAIALAGQMRWFLCWLACHAAFFLAVVLSVDGFNAGTVYAILSYATGAAVMLFINWALDRAHRSSFALSEALEAERVKTEELLYNVLPPVAAQKLKEGKVVADSYSDASVVFIDVVGFSTMAKRVSPGHLIDILNAFFSLADRCAEAAGVEKVKTIGDAYLAISGGNAPSRNSADAALAFAMGVIDGLGDVKAATGVAIEVRIGIHSGPVVGGVIGATRMAYDYWGETMNIASRIEGTASPNGIAISESCFARCGMQARFDAPVMVPLKGVGEMAVYRMRAQGEVVALVG